MRSSTAMRLYISSASRRAFSAFSALVGGLAFAFFFFFLGMAGANVDEPLTLDAKLRRRRRRALAAGRRAAPESSRSPPKAR